MKKMMFRYFQSSFIFMFISNIIFKKMIIYGTKSNILKLVIMLIVLSKSQLYSKNVIINGNFSQPNFTEIYLFFEKSINGWTCSNLCQIDHCTQIFALVTQLDGFFPLCEGNVLDLNSNFTNQIVSQQIRLKSGQYRLNFSYYYPLFNASQKILNVSFNNNIALSLRPQSNGIPYSFHFSQIFQGFEYKNTLTFENLGQNDGEGFKINNVSLVRILDQHIQYFVPAFFQFSFIEGLSVFPGGRVFFGSICSFLINLDRYELYTYHNRLYSYNEQLLLGGIINLQQIKGDIFLQGVSKLFPNFLGLLSQFLDSLNFKSKYISYKSFKLQSIYDNFSLYVSNFIIYSLPGVIISFITLNVLFRLLFNVKISKFIRQYSFYGIILPLFLEGNLQQLTFYSFAELKTFFYFSLKHKIFNVFIIVIFFITVIACFGVHFLFKYHYRKKVNILIESKNSSFQSVLNQNFDKGMMVFFYGATHQLMINSPIPQLAVLGLLQVILMIKKIVMRHSYERGILLTFSILNAFLRIYFQITTYLYEVLEGERKNLNQNYHKYLIILLILKLVLELIFSIFFSLSDAYKIYKKRMDKVQNIPKIDKLPFKKTSFKSIKFYNRAFRTNYQIQIIQL